MIKPFVVTSLDFVEDRLGDSKMPTFDNLPKLESAPINSSTLVSENKKGKFSGKAKNMTKGIGFLNK